MIEAANSEQSYFMLTYEVVENYVELRKPFREEHLAKAREATVAGQLILGGALMEPCDKAVLIFRAPSEAIVEDFVRADPYVLNGLVRSWTIRKWNVVAGSAHQ